MTTAPGEMRAAVLHAPYDLRLEHRPTPAPGRGEVLVRVGSVGVCGSDVHFYEEGRAGSSVVSRPTVLGHEFGGVIAAVGDGVNDRSIGDRVSVEPGIACGECPACLRGEYNHCLLMHFLGAAPIDGALQEFVTVPASHTYTVPAQVTDDAAALIEPLSVALWGASRAAMKAGDDVLIVGAGPIGVLCALVVRAQGAGRVVLIEPHNGRRVLARALTGGEAYTPSQWAARQERTGVALECSGSAAGLAAAAASLSNSGRLVVLGVGVERLELPMNLLQEREITVTGSHRYRDTWPAAIALVASGVINLDALVTARYSLADTEKALQAVRTDPTAMKVCIHVAERIALP